MNEQRLDEELRALRHIAPPENPSGEASVMRAVQAGIDAYDKALEQKQQKNEKNFQGKNRGQRLIATNLSLLEGFFMKKQWMAGTALAGILALGLGALYYPHLNELQQKENIPDDGAAQYPEVAASLKPHMNHTVSSANTGQSAAQENELAILQDIEKKAEAKPKVMTKRSAEAPATLEMSAGAFAPSAPLAEMARSDAAYAPPYMGSGDMVIQPEPMLGDRFDSTTANPLKKVSEEPVSTFSIDVDTASYAYVRRMLKQGALPAPDTVRTEELINYFDYDYPAANSADMPFKPTIALYPTPWNKDTKLLHIGIKGHELKQTEKPRSNLVFLVDVSGSMMEQDKLPLLKNALRLLVENLSAEDTVAIVTYAGQSGTILEPTAVKEKQKILSALEQLQAGGSTAGEAGIRQAYALAEQHKDKEAVNRVILATDGDFNVGIAEPEQLKNYIAEKRKTGIFLSVLGFGQGNYHDALMQSLAQNGNGNAAYIDTLNEAQKVLVDEAASTLFPIAKDVKIQVEFNPQQVAEYRLIGYETRMLQREDFNNDKVDAGDIGAGHTVTALYEITPIGSKAQQVDELRYGKQNTHKPEEDDKHEHGNEIAFLKMRYKLPDGEKSTLLETPITSQYTFDSVKEAPEDIAFAASVAGFGELLKQSPYLQDYDYADVIALANEGKGKDVFGYRAEFISLVRLANSLSAKH